MGIPEGPEEVVARPDHRPHAAGWRAARGCPGIGAGSVHLHDLLTGRTSVAGTCGMRATARRRRMMSRQPGGPFARLEGDASRQRECHGARPPPSRIAGPSRARPRRVIMSRTAPRIAQPPNSHLSSGLQVEGIATCKTTSSILPRSSGHASGGVHWENARLCFLVARRTCLVYAQG